MKYTLIIPVVLALTLGATTLARSAELSAGDIKFLQKAAQLDSFEIQTSKIAEQSASREGVKEFARMMIADHGIVEAELQALAASKGALLPGELSGDERDDLHDLQQKKAQDFDAGYVDKVAVEGHEDAVKLFEYAAQWATDDDIKAFAVKTLPTLRQHLRQGAELRKVIASDSAGMSAPTNAGTLETSPEPPTPAVNTAPDSSAGQPAHEPEPGSVNKAAESQ